MRRDSVRSTMTLATATADGMPSARMVLLKTLDERGLVFYTNRTPERAGSWRPTRTRRSSSTGRLLGRQARVEGTVEEIGEEESDAYSATRPS